MFIGKTSHKTKHSLRNSRSSRPNDVLFGDRVNLRALSITRPTSCGCCHHIHKNLKQEACGRDESWIKEQAVGPHWETLAENLDHRREDYSDKFRASVSTTFIHPPDLPIKQPLHSRCYIPHNIPSIPLRSPRQLPSPLA